MLKASRSLRIRLAAVLSLVVFAAPLASQEPYPGKCEDDPAWYVYCTTQCFDLMMLVYEMTGDKGYAGLVYHECVLMCCGVEVS